MSTAVEEINVTKSGVTIVPSAAESKKNGFQVPQSDSLITVERTKAPRRSPSRIQFGMLRNRSLRILAAIPVELERKKGTVVASWDRIQEFGYGRNISEAVDDFGRTVEELYLSLKDQQQNLSPDLRNILSILREHIGEAIR